MKRLRKTLSAAIGGLALLGAVGTAQAVTLLGDDFDIALTPTSNPLLNFLLSAGTGPNTVSGAVEYTGFGQDGTATPLNSYSVSLDVGAGTLDVQFGLTSGFGAPTPVTPIEYVLTGLEWLDSPGGSPVVPAMIPGALEASDGSGSGATGSVGGGVLSWQVSGGAIRLIWDPTKGNVNDSLSGGSASSPFALNILPTTVATPEPASLALLGLGLAGIGFAGRRGSRQRG